MDTIKVNCKNVKMVAHRGLSGIECENTCAAFVAAANRSYNGIETDVQLTSDGKFILFHDDTTGRLSDCDVKVTETDFETLCGIHLNRHTEAVSDQPLRRDYMLPTLEDYISICKKYGKTAVLEIKDVFPADKIAELVEVFKSFDYLDNTVFISFEWENLIELRRLLPNQTMQFLIGTYDPTLTDRLVEHGFGLDIHYSHLKEEDIIKLHAHDLTVNCWTCDDSKEAERLANLGVDYITSNILE